METSATTTVGVWGDESGSTNGGWKWDLPHKIRYANLLFNGFRSDFTLMLGPDRLKVPVHKIVLQAGSRVLDSSICKSSGNQLVIDSVDPNVFKLVLRYLYTGDSDMKIADALPLLKLATDYEISELRDQCAAMLKNDITDDNVLPLFQGAMEHAHGDLIQSTLGYICQYGQKILKRKQFADLRLECLVEIIQQDKLRVINELAVFNAGEEECKRKGKDMKDLRQILEKPLGYIRFPLMDSSDFALNVATKNILDMTESISLLTCFLVPPEIRNVLPQGRFVSTPRMYLSGDIVMARSVHPGTLRGHLFNSIRETIMIRGDASLKGFAISKPNFQAYYGAQTYYYDQILVNVTVKCGDKVILQNDNQSLATDCNDVKLLQLKFGTPLKLLNDGRWVELTIVIFGHVGYNVTAAYKEITGYKGYNGLYNNERKSVAITSSNCAFVSNYGAFETIDEIGTFHIGVSVKRKDGDTMKMEEGLIEKLYFQT